jgi:hypothetical protein
MPPKTAQALQFEHQGMLYGVLIDIYAPFGFVIFEVRDKFKKALDPLIPGFMTIFKLAKETIASRSKGSIKARQPRVEKSQFRAITSSSTGEYQETPTGYDHFLPYLIVEDNGSVGLISRNQIE